MQDYFCGLFCMECSSATRLLLVLLLTTIPWGLHTFLARPQGGSNSEAERHCILKCSIPGPDSGLDVSAARAAKGVQ